MQLPPRSMTKLIGRSLVEKKQVGMDYISADRHE
jgi:hypothetical protein